MTPSFLRICNYYVTPLSNLGLWRIPNSLLFKITWMLKSYLILGINDRIFLYPSHNHHSHSFFYLWLLICFWLAVSFFLSFQNAPAPISASLSLMLSEQEGACEAGQRSHLGPSHRLPAPTLSLPPCLHPQTPGPSAQSSVFFPGSSASAAPLSMLDPWYLSDCI